MPGASKLPAGHRLQSMTRIGPRVPNDNSTCEIFWNWRKGGEGNSYFSHQLGMRTHPPTENPGTPISRPRVTQPRPGNTSVSDTVSFSHVSQTLLFMSLKPTLRWGLRTFSRNVLGKISLKITYPVTKHNSADREPPGGFATSLTALAACPPHNLGLGVTHQKWPAAGS